ncbi:MAG: nuclear transport factor 2 family protein [Candidatus Thorarchaeota archaeon]
MYEKDALEFCKEWLSAWTGNQPEKLIEFYTKDAFYKDPANPNGLKGHDEILPYFRKLLERNPEWKWEVVEVYPTKNGFTFKWRAEIPVGSKVIEEEGVDIVEILFRKISRNEVYFDRTKWLEAIRESDWF